jgi:hypothetical protein
MQDKILASFLQNSFADAKQLESESGVFSICESLGSPPSRFLLRFSGLDHLVQDPADGRVHVSQQPVLVGVNFPPDYLRRIDENLYLKVVCLLNPDFFHPNVKSPLGWICLGHAFMPGTTLSDLVYHLYDIVTYQNMTVDEQDAFNADACRYLRQYPETVAKLQRPPLRHQPLQLQVKVKELRKS